MSICTFFGHRDCPDTVIPELQALIEHLIEQQGVDVFYVGNQGHFDACVRSVLRRLSKKYPQIRYYVVLAYLPVEKRENTDFSDTLFPEGMELIHPRFAIDRRNKWMAEQSRYVVCYLRRPWGGAAQYVKMAEQKGKTVYRL